MPAHHRRADVSAIFKVKGYEVCRLIYLLRCMCAVMYEGLHEGLQMTPHSCDVTSLNCAVWSPVLCISTDPRISRELPENFPKSP